MHDVASASLYRSGVGDARHVSAVGAKPDGTAVAILVCDPRPLTRECLAYALTQQWPGAVVREVADVRQLGEGGETLAHDCQLAIVNLGARSMLAPDVTEILDGLERACPVPIVVISDDESCASVSEAMRRGVRAYVGTMCSLPVLIGILNLVRVGGTYVPSTSVTGVGPRPAPQAPPPEVALPQDPVVHTFTPREIEILQGLKDGKPNKIIAHELRISESTAKVHIRHIMGKMSVTNRTQAALLACQLLNGSD